MTTSRSGFTRGVRVALLGALVLLLIAPAAYATDRVLIDAKVIGKPAIGKTVTIKLNIRILDGSRLRSVTWDRIGGAPVTITPQGARAAKVQLGTEDGFRQQLIHVLSEAPVPMATEFFGGLQNRWQVVAINPLALEEAGLVGIQANVNTTSGLYHKAVGIPVGLPWSTTTGLTNVPIGQPVLVYGKDQASYAWTMTGPWASDAVLKNANTRNPFFTPDAPGAYEVKVNDVAAGRQVTLTIYAGMWRGVVVGQDDEGYPVAATACTNCHGSNLAPDKFGPWSETGHSRIFSDNLNTSDHYGTTCLSCHTVGYDPLRKNGGIDEASDFAKFVKSDLLHGAAPTNWATMLSKYPNAAGKANIQCENCHGPQLIANDDTPAHGLGGEAVGNPRVSLSSDLCGSCHGEPLRHARYQQWQISGHANYETARGEGTNGGCAKCHSAQGFLAKLPVWTGQVAGDPKGGVTVTWTTDEVHAQTCVTCHDPHDMGSTTGVTSDAKVRQTGAVFGDTPLLDADFKAMGVGSGALCMTCHNSRRNLRNDDTYDPADADRAPHVGTQADMLMGENLYFVEHGVRGRHSLVENTCVTCHMVKAKPPANLSMNQAGTNHTFLASSDVCTECHTGVDGENLARGFETVIHDLELGIEAKIRQLMAEQIAAGNTISIDVDGTGGVPAVIVDDMTDIDAMSIMDAHGRQAIDVTVNGTRIVSGNPPEPGVRMANVKVIRPAPAAAVTLYSTTDNSLPKAFWNYLVVETDGSKGAHNPSWILDALNEARRAVGRTGPAALRKSDLAIGMK